VFSDQENRELAGKLNDPGEKKNGKLPGISLEEGKSGHFHSILLILQMGNC